MKTILKFTFTVLLLIIITSCSSDDGDTNELQTQLIGKWLFENPNSSPDINNSFTFTSSGNVIYSYWTGSETNYDSETGTFSFDEDIMTMVFPDDVSLTYVQKVVFINDNTIEFQSTGVSGDNAYEGVYFRDGVELTGSEKAYRIEFTTGDLESWVSVGLETTLDFTDRTQKVINSEFDRTNNIVTVEVPKNVNHFKLKFYIEDSSTANMKFYALDNNALIHKETINKQEYEYEYTFE